MKLTKLAILAVGMLCSSVSSFAAPSCADYAEGVNADLVKKMAFATSYTYENLSFKESGKIVSTEQSDPYDVRLKKYKLPPSIAKKMYYRFNKVDTMGVRPKTGRLVCFFTVEYSDGYKADKKSFTFDIYQSGHMSDIRMIFGQEEVKTGFAFSALEFAQEITGMAISKTVVNDAEFKAQLARTR